MKIGDWIYTPRFCKVRIDEIFDTIAKAYKEGYTEPTHYIDTEYKILGKSLDGYHMVFAAAKK